MPNVGFPGADLTLPRLLLIDDFSFCNSELRCWRIASAIVESSICLRVVRLNCRTHPTYQPWTSSHITKMPRLDTMSKLWPSLLASGACTTMRMMVSEHMLTYLSRNV